MGERGVTRRKATGGQVELSASWRRGASELEMRSTGGRYELAVSSRRGQGEYEVTARSPGAQAEVGGRWFEFKLLR